MKINSSNFVDNFDSFQCPFCNSTEIYEEDIVNSILDLEFTRNDEIKYCSNCSYSEVTKAYAEEIYIAEHSHFLKIFIQELNSSVK